MAPCLSILFKLIFGIVLGQFFDLYFLLGEIDGNEADSAQNSGIDNSEEGISTLFRFI